MTAGGRQHLSAGKRFIPDLEKASRKTLCAFSLTPKPHVLSFQPPQVVQNVGFGSISTTAFDKRREHTNRTHPVLREIPVSQSGPIRATGRPESDLPAIESLVPSRSWNNGDNCPVVRVNDYPDPVHGVVESLRRCTIARERRAVLDGVLNNRRRNTSILHLVYCVTRVLPPIDFGWWVPRWLKRRIRPLYFVPVPDGTVFADTRLRLLPTIGCGRGTASASGAGLRNPDVNAPSEGSL